ncbi:dynein axonemal heavy chain 1-like isoform X3 [Synchiropus splendidus]|uniref:dynein axonemal heavy chain 1-like isoform X3 n=1 Tax=Synchiropus splendidus TaxID=270530 RepID=UPI00237E8C0B|nr:dynein axonemal heavy chain 1-like isoform X3 [Synchiropus splendidus]
MEKEVPPEQRRLAEYWPPTGKCQLRPLERKQRGVYSDDIINNPRFKIISDGKLQPSVSMIRESPYTAPVTVDFCKVTDYFSSGGDKPKVQIPHKSMPGSVPRRIAVERLRRQYMKTDIEQLLFDQGIDISRLQPKHFGEQMNSSVNGYLPLEIFDNEDFDCRTPGDWLALGKPAGSGGQKPVPAKALLPIEEGLFVDNSSETSSMYHWHLVGVLDYSEETRRYLVEKVVLSRKLQEETSDQWSNRTKQEQGVSTVVTCGKHWVPRIREETEALLLYHLYVDCMPVCDGSPSIDSLALQRITKNALSAPGFTPKTLETCVQTQETEVKLQYDRAMNSMVFDAVVRSSPELFSYVKLPQEYLPPKGPAALVPLPSYSENKRLFSVTSLLNSSDVIKVLSEVQSQCSKVANMKLFNVSFNKPLGLEEFRGNQSQIHTQTSLFLHESWVPTLCNSFRCNFGSHVKGAYNLRESCWEVYNTSRLHRFMPLVRYHMEDALRHLVRSSLVSLGHVILDACSSLVTCPADMVWGDSLITSCFQPKNHPVFHVDLVLAPSGAHYSTPVEEFQTAVTHLFDEGIRSTHNVPRLEKFVLPNLFFGGDPVISSVSLWEAEVVELREKISGALSKAAVVLKAYAAEYSQFIDLHNTDVNGSFKSAMEGCQTSQEVRKELERHLKEKDRLEQLLPTSLVIGPFLIQLETVRQSLFNKTNALVIATLKHFASILCNQVDDVCEECDVIHKKLHKMPDSIEELSEKKLWMEQLPDRLDYYKETLVKILSEYELLHEFCHVIPKQDVNKRFTAMVWPLKISKDIQAVTAQHVELEHHFQKNLQSDQNNFEDHLDSLQEQVAGLGGHVDMAHAHDIVNKVRSTGRLLQESQALAETYNNRQRLLGLAVTSYDRVEAMVKDFQPYSALWTTTFDWLHWQKIWLNDPLTSIEPEMLERNVAQALETMAGCVEHFKETPGCQVVATEIHGKIKDFARHIPMIQGLRHPGMKPRHWEMLAQQTGIIFMPVTDLTFSLCLDLGLQNHVAAVAEVVEIAEMEFAVEQSLEEMQHSWSTVCLDVLPHQESGSYRVQVPEEVFSLLESHLAVTRNMYTSPVKEVFDDRIRSWELRLTLAKEVLLEWLACQSSWVCLESASSSDAIGQIIPEEAKMHKHVDRVWRRIMKIAFDNSKVMDLCSEDCLLDELKLCNKVLKGLAQTLENGADSGLKSFI